MRTAKRSICPGDIAVLINAFGGVHCDEANNRPMIRTSWVHVAPVRHRKKPIRRGSGALPRRLRRCWKCVRWVGRKLAAAPRTLRIAAIAATVLAVFFAANFVYHVVRKPTEMFFPVSGALNKMPLETWRQYAPLFRQ